ncbi:hypothetical protein LA080_000682 [Diaporthe eres]|nr:hypothetical protein LA080_000682 [Diaporthe eres]
MAFRITITGHSTNFNPPTGTPTCSVCGKAGSSGLPQTKAKPLWFWLKTAKWDFDGDSLAYSLVNCRLGISCFPMPPWEVLHEHIPQDGLAHGLMALVTPDYKKGGPQAVPNELITALLKESQPALYNSVIVFAYQTRTIQGSNRPSSAVVVEDLQMRGFGKIVEAYQRHASIGREASPL